MHDDWDREWKIEAGFAFAVGGYRDNSHDSRSKGPIRVDSIIGRPTHISYSWDSLSFNLRWERTGLVLR